MRREENGIAASNYNRYDPSLEVSYTVYRYHTEPAAPPTEVLQQPLPPERLLIKDVGHGLHQHTTATNLQGEGGITYNAW